MRVYCCLWALGVALAITPAAGSNAADGEYRAPASERTLAAPPEGQPPQVVQPESTRPAAPTPPAPATGYAPYSTYSGAGGSPADKQKEDVVSGTTEFTRDRSADTGRVTQYRDPQTGDIITSVVPPAPPRQQNPGIFIIAPQLYPGSPYLPPQGLAPGIGSGLGDQEQNRE